MKVNLAKEAGKVCKEYAILYNDLPSISEWTV